MNSMRLFKTIVIAFGAVIGAVIPFIIIALMEDRLMSVIFGEGWYFADILICFLPLLYLFIGVIGGVLGDMIGYWLLPLNPVFLYLHSTTSLNITLGMLIGSFLGAILTLLLAEGISGSR